MSLDMRRAHFNEDGFTLVELLAVILIIGILAAVAIPLFLNQRTKGYDSAAKSDLRNLAGFEEIYLSDANAYGTIAAIQALEPTLSVSTGVTLTVVRFDLTNGYCLSAKHSASPTTWYWDSRGGGLQSRGSSACPVSTTGLAGDSQTG
jgi:type IV pilus assembly protein PilA